MLGLCASQRARKKPRGQAKRFGIRSGPWLPTFQSSRPYDAIWLCCGHFWCCTVPQKGDTVCGPAVLKAPNSGSAQLPRAGEALYMRRNSSATQNAKRKAAVGVQRRLLVVLASRGQHGSILAPKSFGCLVRYFLAGIETRGHPR
jgi:hypothetical protein